MTRLFADPEWDGEVEQVEGFTGGVPLSVSKSGKPGGQTDPKPIVDENGCPVKSWAKPFPSTTRTENCSMWKM